MEDESFKQRSQDCEEVYHSSSSDGINEDQREAMSTVVQSSEATSNNQTDDESKPRIINTENDYDLMYNLHHLVAVETQFSDDETDLNQYRLGVKRLMQQFLTKFEETLEYQKYLENEVARLNHSVSFCVQSRFSKYLQNLTIFLFFLSCC